jgi:hypothetical protein
LCGQPIVREAHYNMLIVRCPECATIASLQEHPMLGRWATRWAVVFAGLWLVVLLAAALITGGFSYGITTGLGVKATEPYAAFLSEQQTIWLESNDSLNNQPQMWRHSRAEYNAHLHDDWWRTQDPDALLASVGGWMRIADWNVAWGMAIWSPLWIAAGCVWALFLPHVRRRWLPLCSLALITVPLFFVLIAYTDPFRIGWAWSIGDTVYPQVGMKVQIVALLLMTIPLSIGLLLGRTVARLLVRALLPPRMRGSLAGLWFIDGLQPPAGTRVVRR